jgi:hypothetical protein
VCGTWLHYPSGSVCALAVGRAVVLRLIISCSSQSQQRPATNGSLERLDQLGHMKCLPEIETVETAETIKTADTMSS